MFISNNRLSFHLWRKENLVKHQKFSKYYENDCSLFPFERKKENIVPIHKKSDKENIKNYRLVSLLPICGNLYERLRHI